jgi:hypothetical protein
MFIGKVLIMGDFYFSIFFHFSHNKSMLFYNIKKQSNDDTSKDFVASVGTCICFSMMP